MIKVGENFKEKVSWYRPDLAYEHLHQIKMSVSYYAGQNDLVGWLNALMTEYRFIWEFIVELAKKDDISQEHFEKEFNKSRAYIYDPRNDLDNPSSNRIQMSNYNLAYTILHNLNLLMNKYEAKAELLITTKMPADPGKAILSYGG